MALQSVIFDNTVFNHFARLKSIKLIPIIQNTIADKVIVPSEVLVELTNFRNEYPEYNQKISSWINSISSSRNFEHCSSYDSLVLDFARHSIDKGEAEAVAQAQKRGLKFFITDEKKCIPFIKKNYPDIRTFSSFFLIAVADLHDLVSDYDETIIEYHKILGYQNMTPKKKKEHKGILRQEYKSAMSLFSLNIDKKIISVKTSIDTICRNRNK